MDEVILAFLIPAIFLGLWIWLVPTPALVEEEKPKSDVLFQRTQPKMLFCIGGPLDGQSVEVRLGQQRFETYVPDEEPLQYHPASLEQVARERDVEIFTYLRGSIMHSPSGILYRYLYPEGSAEFASGVEHLCRIGVMQREEAGR